MPRELITTAEECDFRGGRCRFVSQIVCWREDGRLYRVEHPYPTFDLDALEAPPIPLDHLYPKWRDGLLEAPSPIPGDVFVKAPRVLSYAPSYPERLPDDTWAEVSILEQLRKTPHPNICVYRGCVREGDYIVGIALQRYPQNLYEHMESGELLDRRRIVADVKAGLEHLHGLGLIHGDLSPANVMIADGRAILVDFGATIRQGEQKVVAGTPGWYREGSVASKENDFFSLGIMTQWLEHGEDLDPDDIPEDTPTAWTEDYLKPKVMVCGSQLALENACDVLVRLFGEWSRVTLLLKDVSRARKAACLVPLLDSNKVHLVEGSLLVKEDYQRAWETAGSGLRGGDIDLVLFLSTHDTDTAFGLRAFQAETRRALNVPMVHAWTVSSRYPDPWLTFVNFPSGKSEYVSALRHLAWHRCHSTGLNDERKTPPSQLLRKFSNLEDGVKPACTRGEKRTRCYENICLVQLSAVTSSQPAHTLLSSLCEGTLHTWKQDWSGSRTTSRNHLEDTPEMWLEIDEFFSA